MGVFDDFVKGQSGDGAKVPSPSSPVGSFDDFVKSQSPSSTGSFDSFVKQQTSDVTPLLNQMRNAERSQESGGSSNPNSIQNPRTGATGQFQVMPANVPSWTKKHYGQQLTLDQFKANPEAQNAVFTGEMGDYLRSAKSRGVDDDTAIRMGAAAWYGGKGAMHRYDDPTKFRPNEPSFQEYTNSVLNKIKKGGNQVYNATPQSYAPNAANVPNVPITIGDAIEPTYNTPDGQRPLDAPPPITADSNPFAPVSNPTVATPQVLQNQGETGQNPVVSPDQHFTIPESNIVDPQINRNQANNVSAPSNAASLTTPTPSPSQLAQQSAAKTVVTQNVEHQKVKMSPLEANKQGSAGSFTVDMSQKPKDENPGRFMLRSALEAMTPDHNFSLDDINKAIDDLKLKSGKYTTVSDNLSDADIANNPNQKITITQDLVNNINKIKGTYADPSSQDEIKQRQIDEQVKKYQISPDDIKQQLITQHQKDYNYALAHRLPGKWSNQYIDEAGNIKDIPAENLDDNSLNAQTNELLKNQPTKDQIIDAINQGHDASRLRGGLVGLGSSALETADAGVARLVGANDTYHSLAQRAKAQQIFADVTKHGDDSAFGQAEDFLASQPGTLLGLGQFAVLPGGGSVMFGAHSAATAAGSGANPKQIAEAAGEGAGTGALFDIAGAMKPIARIATIGLGTGAITYANGGNLTDSVKAGISNVAFDSVMHYAPQVLGKIGRVWQDGKSTDIQAVKNANGDVDINQVDIPKGQQPDYVIKAPDENSVQNQQTVIGKVKIPQSQPGESVQEPIVNQPEVKNTLPAESKPVKPPVETPANIEPEKSAVKPEQLFAFAKDKDGQIIVDDQGQQYQVSKNEFKNRTTIGFSEIDKDGKVVNQSDGGKFGHVTKNDDGTFVTSESLPKFAINGEAKVNQPESLPAESKPVEEKQPFEMTKAEFQKEEDLRKQYTSQYLDERGNKIASSLTTPSKEPDLPLGTWRIGNDKWNKYGNTIRQLREIPIDKIEGVEDDSSREGDADRYAQWIKEGKKAPPLEASKYDDGMYQIRDGHRRLSAAKKAGEKTIRAWVSDSAETGLTDSSGKPILTGLTHELAIKQALAEGRKVPDNVLAEYPDLVIKQPYDSRSEVGKEREDQRQSTEKESNADDSAEQTESTSTKNSVVDIEREKGGLAPIMPEARREFGKVWDEAAKEIESNPDVSKNLVESLKNNPRPVSDKENAMLLHRKIVLNNEFDKASENLIKAYDSKDVAKQAETALEVARINDERDALDKVTKQVGAELGRGLSARRMLAKEDYSLASLEKQKRAALGGRPLTVEEHKSLAETQKKLAETQRAYDEYRLKTDDHIAKMEANRKIRDLTHEVDDPALKGVRDLVQKITNKLGDRAQKARERLAAKGHTFNAGFDPRDLRDWADIGAHEIAKVGNNFADWSTRMLSEFNDLADEHLKTIYDAAMKVVDRATGNKSVREKVSKGVEAGTTDITDVQSKIIENIKEKYSSGDITNDVQKLAKEYVKQGIRDREPLIDKVHETLKTIDPDIERRDVMDAISGYGKFKQLSKDAISQTLSDLKGQMRQVSKLEDVKEGKQPAKSGLERRVPSAAEKDLADQVKTAQGKAARTVESVKKGLEKRIFDLDNAIKSNTKIERNQRTTPTNPVVETLKTRKTELQKIYDETFGKTEKKPLSDEQRLANYKKAIEKRTAELQTKINNQDYSTKPRRALNLDEEAKRLQVANELVKNKFKRDLEADRLKNLPLYSKIGGKILDAPGFFKSVLASFDDSAIFRQGWKTLFTNPVIWQKNARQSFVDIAQSLRNKPVMENLQYDIDNRPNAKNGYYKKAALDVGVGLHEEEFPTSLPEKIPILGRAYKASENAYSGFLRRTRADVFDKYIALAKKGGVDLDDTQLKNIGRLVNALTGRGYLGGNVEKAASTINTIFFSPRNLKGHIDTLLQPITGGTSLSELKEGTNTGSNFVRKQAALNVAKYVAGSVAILAIANWLRPGSVEKDPRSADFGKIKIGNTRFDVTGGMGSLITLASRLATGKTKSSTSGAMRDLNSPGFGGQDKLDVFLDFMENKLSPVAGIVKDYAKGKTFDGKPVNIKDEGLGLITPLPIKTFQELLKDPEAQKDPRFVAFAQAMDMLGISTNTYTAQPSGGGLGKMSGLGSMKGLK